MERMFNRLPADQVGRRVVNGRWDQRKPGRPANLETVARPALVVPPPSETPRLVAVLPAPEKMSEDEILRRMYVADQLDALYENPVSLADVHQRQLARYRATRPRRVTERSSKVEYVYESVITPEMPDWA